MRYRDAMAEILRASNDPEDSMENAFQSAGARHVRAGAVGFGYHLASTAYLC